MFCSRWGWATPEPRAPWCAGGCPPRDCWPSGSVSGWPSPPELRAAALDGAAAALGAASGLGPDGAVLAQAARAAFAAGLSAALWVGAGVLAAAAVVCAIVAPGRTSSADAATDPDGGALEAQPR